MLYCNLTMSTCMNFVTPNPQILLYFCVLASDRHLCYFEIFNALIKGRDRHIQVRAVTPVQPQIPTGSSGSRNQESCPLNIRPLFSTKQKSKTFVLHLAGVSTPCLTRTGSRKQTPINPVWLPAATQCRQAGTESKLDIQQSICIIVI